MAICGIEQTRPRPRPKKDCHPANKRRAGCLIEGAVTTNWKRALEQLSLIYPERINQHL